MRRNLKHMRTRGCAARPQIAKSARMSSILTILALLAVAVVAAYGFRMAMPNRAAKPKGASNRTTGQSVDLKERLARSASHLDQVDTIADGVTLSELLQNRPDPVPLPQGLLRRAERLQLRHRETSTPEPMRVLAKLLIDTVDAGLPDVYAFHDAARILLSCADDGVLHEFAAEAEQRLMALTPWLDLNLSAAALEAAQQRVPGALDRLVDRMDSVRQQIWTDRVDELLSSIGQCAQQGRPASGDSLALANYIAKRPELAPRAVSEMAVHPESAVWLTAWLMLEGRLLASDHPVTVPAFRGRVLSAFSQNDAPLVATAADAAQVLLDHSAFADVSGLTVQVSDAMARVQPAPKALMDLAERLGIVPEAEAQ